MPAHRRPLKDKVRRQDAHSIRGGKNISAIISTKKTLPKKVMINHSVGRNITQQITLTTIECFMNRKSYLYTKLRIQFSWSYLHIFQQIKSFTFMFDLRLNILLTSSIIQIELKESVIHQVRRIRLNLQKRKKNHTRTNVKILWEGCNHFPWSLITDLSQNLRLPV